MRQCPNCGSQVSDKAVFCDQCGSRLPAPEPAVAETVVQAAPVTPPPAGGIPEDIVLCASCGAENVPGEVFCDVCGEPLESPQPAGQTVIPEAAIEEAAIEEAAIEEVVVEEVVVEEPVVEKVIVEEVVEEIVPEPAAPETLIEEVEIVEAALPEVEAAPAVSAPVASGTYCPVCGASTRASDTFCGSCGAALGGAVPMVTAAPAVAPAAAPVTPAPAAAVEEVVPVPVITGPYLQVKASSAHIPLTPQPELLVGRLDEVSGIEPEVDMTPHGGLDGGVSRRHAKLIYEGKAWFVLDLDSTNGTFVNGIEVKPRVRTPIKSGDQINFGDVELVFFAG